MLPIRLSLLSLLVLGACAKTAPPAQPAAGQPDGLLAIADSLDAPLPIDPRVKIGTLPNGLTYYLEHNERPAERAELRLAVKAGSVLEDDDQRGLAHFVEHMAFNGSEHFAGNELVTYLESIGTQFGAHLNAYTSFDETVYMLRIPTDDPEIVDKGMWVLRDWAGALTFDVEECERERGVVLEEWRLGQGLSQRVQDAMLADVFGGSVYGERLPIGTEQSLETFDCEAAVRFYKDWYRPELMAVMVVGDLDMAAMEATIQERFGSLTNPEGARERVYHRIPDHDAPMVTVFRDHELSSNSLSVMSKVDDIEGNTHGSYREYLVEAIAWGVLNERLAIVSQQPDVPFLGAMGQQSGVGYQRAGDTVGIAPKQGQELEALRAVMTEVERLRRYGVTESEVGRMVSEQARGYQSYYDERDKTDSSTHVEELIRVFLTGEPMPGIAYEYALAASYLHDISVEEVNGFIQGMLPDRSRVVQLMMPLRDGLEAPTEEELLAVLAEVAEAEIAPPEGDGELPDLMAQLPEPGTIVEEGYDETLGITTWILSNGVKVVLRPSDYMEDELVFTSFSPGGHSLASDEAFVPAVTATSLAVQSGLGEHDVVTLGKILAGHGASVSPYISEHHEGISGGGSALEAELILQLSHLTFTAPRFSPDVFERDVAARRQSLEHRSASPDARFWDAWTELVWQDHSREMPWRMEDLEQMDLEASQRFYEDRFGDAGDFTFVFAGSFTLEELRPLVERYLASLPSSSRVEEGRDRGARMVKGEQTQEMSFGDTPRGRVQLQFHGDFAPDWISRNQLTALASVAETRLREKLREELGGTYGVSVGSDSSKFPVPMYTFSVGFQCDPERVDELTEAMWSVLDELRSEPVEDSLIATIQEKRRRERETTVRSNEFWAGAIAGAMRRGEDPHALLTFDLRNDALTAADVHQLAQKVIQREDYVLMVQRPEAE